MNIQEMLQWMKSKHILMIDQAQLPYIIFENECLIDDAWFEEELEEQGFSKYEKGFDIMMEYFDSIPDEEKEEVDAKLKALNL